MRGFFATLRTTTVEIYANYFRDRTLGAGYQVRGRDLYQANYGRRVAFVGVAADSIADGNFQFGQGLGFGEDGSRQDAGFVTALRAVDHFEDDLAGFHRPLTIHAKRRAVRIHKN